ncbi:MAG TPA: DUF2851 family protein [Flavobacterium sp.]|jgi:hypothetical protein
MKEDFLHYLWKFKKFNAANLTSANGEQITIINSGQYLQLSGPDFFNAQLIIGNQKWAGNIEIHIRSSDWYVHNHETDPAYENVILHVVWEHDVEIFRKDASVIPVLELSKYTEAATVESYRQLMSAKKWIYCEDQIAKVDSVVRRSLMERLFFERLERKSQPVIQVLSKNGNDWEAALFRHLAMNFGLNTNGAIFGRMAESIPFAVVRKESADVLNLESIFFGCCGMLEAEHEDVYFRNLKGRWNYLAMKYNLADDAVPPPEFFKHRPDNFPTIRLAQLAQLYHLRQNLFSQILESESIKDFSKLLRVNVSEYWESHYLFDKQSRSKKKMLSDPFINLLLINGILPLKFAYARTLGKEPSEELIALMERLPPEKNGIIEKFASVNIEAANAFDSQSLLQLKSEYCNRGRCLECSIGIALMKPETDEKVRKFEPLKPV